MFSIYLKDENFYEPDDQIYYLVAENGVYLVKKTPFFISSTLIFGPVRGKSLSFLMPHQSGVKLHLPQKIPICTLKEIVNLFREIYRKTESEAIVILYWSEREKVYKMIVPEQEIGPALISYYAIGKNPEGMIRVGTIHSHGGMKAFHSHVDEYDEKHDDGIHITIGNLDYLDFLPSFACSVVVDGERFAVKKRDIMELEEEIPVPPDFANRPIMDYMMD